MIHIGPVHISIICGPCGLDVLSSLGRIEGYLRQLVTPPRPQAIKAVLIREEDNMLVYQANLPTLPSPLGDIVTQRLSVTSNDVSVLEIDLDTTATVSPEFRVNQGENVKLSLRYVDDADPANVSSPSTQEFVANDTIAPDAPGAFGEVTLLREEP